MFWQNKKKNSIFCECLSILDILRKWLLRRILTPGVECRTDLSTRSHANILVTQFYNAWHFLLYYKILKMRGL